MYVPHESYEKWERDDFPQRLIQHPAPVLRQLVAVMYVPQPCQLELHAATAASLLVGRTPEASSAATLWAPLHDEELPSRIQLEDLEEVALFDLIAEHPRDTDRTPTRHRRDTIKL
eukprot:9312748-Pyramimonas_sp.AAC.1